VTEKTAVVMVNGVCGDGDKDSLVPWKEGYTESTPRGPRRCGSSSQSRPSRVPGVVGDGALGSSANLNERRDEDATTLGLWRLFRKQEHVRRRDRYRYALRTLQTRRRCRDRCREAVKRDRAQQPCWAGGPVRVPNTRYDGRRSEEQA
jgi:hypothetical protein